MQDNIKFKIDSNVKIVGKQTGEVFLDKSNAIHPQHFALIFANALAGKLYSSIYGMVLGNGGSYIDSTGKIIYNPPNTSGNDARLYNQTYLATIDNSNNTLTVVPSNTDLTSSVIVSVILGASSVTGQYASDTSDINNPANPQNLLVPGSPNIPAVMTSTGADFDFDELGLVVQNSVSSPTYLLLTHLLFSPIQKNANRELLVTYTLSVSVS